jgi:type VI secretion system secreted protein VgrG
MSLTQTNRQIGIDTPLGEDVLLLRSFQGHEAVSRLFTFDLDLVSEDLSVNYDDMVGKAVTVRLGLSDGSLRYWNGFVSRFIQAGRDSNVAVYQATIVPWLWFLDQTTDCRIFQNKTAPEIIKQIFQENSYNDVLLRLYGDFVKRDYCVQYRESDFNFVSRLMEEEGIFYFFEHEDGKHTLILGNDPAAHKECPKQPSARYEGTAGGWQDDDVILQWLQEQELRPSIYTTMDYNFETPSTSLLSSVNGKGKWEVYDFPGEYAKRADGDKLVRVRLQEQQVSQSVARGMSDCRAFSVGYKFKLTDHYRDDLNQEYVLTSLRHSARHNVGYISGASDFAEPAYENSFECIPAKTPLRPERRTPVPVVQGCQTAVIVGPGGEEIFTDQYGRVKVQFHWDREGKKNENSSCWVRVSYPWAGKGWGGIQVPRIGQEVIVDFLEGDPDRPLITGRTYNAGQMPPWSLPGKMMVSGYKSNSTKGGGGYNELSFDDTKGTELINIHAQYDQQKKVENDERVDIVRDRTEHVGRDERITIDHDRTEEVKHDEKIRIGNDKTEVVVQDRRLEVERDKSESVGRNKTVVVRADHDETVDGSMSVSVKNNLSEIVALNHAETVGLAMEITVGGAMAISVGLAMAETVGLNKSEAVGKSKSESVGVNKSLDVGKNLSETVRENQNVEIGKDLTEEIGGRHREEVKKEFSLQAKKIELVAEDEISLKAGDAVIVLKKNGDITIKGAKINVNGSGEVAIKGSKIKEN